jgi:hypothetical protein
MPKRVRKWFPSHNEKCCFSIQLKDNQKCHIEDLKMVVEDQLTLRRSLPAGNGQGKSSGTERAQLPPLIRGNENGEVTTASSDC